MNLNSIKYLDFYNDNLLVENYSTQQKRFIASGIPKETVESYISLFKKIRDAKYKVAKDADINGLNVPKGNSRFDIDRYKTFKELELFVDYVRGQIEMQNTKSKNLKDIEIDDADILVRKNGLEIYYGKDREACIKYRGNIPYSWCVSRDDHSNMFGAYRYAGGGSTFYFVKDIEATNQEFSHPFSGKFNNKWHFFVIQVMDIYEDGLKYIVTSAENDGDEEMSWEEILKIQPKLHGMREYFKSVPLTDLEKKIFSKYKGSDVDPIDYQKMSFEEKSVYIDVNSTHPMSNEIFALTPDILKNKYIGFGHELTNEQYNLIRNNKSLISRYAEIYFRFISSRETFLSHVSENGILAILESLPVRKKLIDFITTGKKTDRTLKITKITLEQIISNDWNPEEFFPRDFLKEFVEINFPEDMDVPAKKIIQFIKKYSADKKFNLDRHLHFLFNIQKMDTHERHLSFFLDICDDIIHETGKVSGFYRALLRMPEFVSDTEDTRPSIRKIIKLIMEGKTDVNLRNTKQVLDMGFFLWAMSPSVLKFISDNKDFFTKYFHPEFQFLVKIKKHIPSTPKLDEPDDKEIYNNRHRINLILQRGIKENKKFIFGYLKPLFHLPETKHAVGIPQGLSFVELLELMGRDSLLDLNSLLHGSIFQYIASDDDMRILNENLSYEEKKVLYKANLHSIGSIFHYLGHRPFNYMESFFRYFSKCFQKFIVPENKDVPDDSLNYFVTELEKKYQNRSRSVARDFVKELFKYYITNNGNNSQSLSVFFLFLPLQLLETEASHLSTEIYKTTPIQFQLLFDHWNSSIYGGDYGNRMLRLDFILRMTIHHINEPIFTEYIVNDVIFSTILPYYIYARFLSRISRRSDFLFTLTRKFISQFGHNHYAHGITKDFPPGYNLVTVLKLMDQNSLKTFLTVNEGRYLLRHFFKSVSVYRHSGPDNTEMYHYLSDLIGKEKVDQEIKDYNLHITETYMNYNSYFK